MDMNHAKQGKQLGVEAEKTSGQMYFDAETVRLATEKREASRKKRLAEKLRLAKMAGNKGGEVV